MGKSKQKFIVISGFDIHDNNRGTQALGYGSLSFLEQRYGLTPDTKILSLRFIKNPLKHENRINKVDKVRVGDKEFCIKTLNVFFLEKTLLEKFHITLPLPLLERQYAIWNMWQQSMAATDFLIYIVHRLSIGDFRRR